MTCTVSGYGASSGASGAGSGGGSAASAGGVDTSAGASAGGISKAKPPLSTLWLVYRNGAGLPGPILLATVRDVSLGRMKVSYDPRLPQIFVPLGLL